MSLPKFANYISYNSAGKTCDFSTIFIIHILHFHSAVWSLFIHSFLTQIQLGAAKITILDYSAIIMFYLCVSMLQATRPSLTLQSYRKVGMGSLTCATILVHAVQRKAASQLELVAFKYGGLCGWHCTPSPSPKKDRPKKKKPPWKFS